MRFNRRPMTGRRRIYENAEVPIEVINEVLDFLEKRTGISARNPKLIDNIEPYHTFTADINNKMNSPLIKSFAKRMWLWLAAFVVDEYDNRFVVDIQIHYLPHDRGRDGIEIGKIFYQDGKIKGQFVNKSF